VTDGLADGHPFHQHNASWKKLEEVDNIKMEKIV